MAMIVFMWFDVGVEFGVDVEVDVDVDVGADVYHVHVYVNGTGHDYASTKAEDIVLLMTMMATRMPLLVKLEKAR